ncbi:general odorant-binding protein 56a isoform X2 [Anabrus simplex]
MKTLLLVCTFSAVVALAIAGMTKKDLEKKIKEAREECKNEFPITEEEEKGLREGEPPASQEGKCFLSCMFRACGTMKDGKFDPEGAKNKAKILFSDDKDKEQKACDVIDQCSKEVTTDDTCETGPKIMECYKGKMPK